VSDCDAKLVVNVGPKFRWVDLSLQEKEGNILPAKRAVWFNLYDDNYIKQSLTDGNTKISGVKNGNGELLEINFEMRLLCNETYYISPIITDPQLGYSLDSWDCLSGNDCTPVSSSPSDLTLELEMTEDKNSIFYFSLGFRLEMIAVYQAGYDNTNDSKKLTNHRVYTTNSGYPNDLKPSVELAFDGSIPVYPGGSIYFRQGKLNFYFSDKINLSSVYNGGIIIQDKLSYFDQINSKSMRWYVREIIVNYIGTSINDKSISLKNDYTGFGSVNEYIQFETVNPDYVSTTHYN
ncbi:MAG: hypothetical protein RIF34_08135, partial [Candidatus Kapaibacterium sp.]